MNHSRRPHSRCWSSWGFGPPFSPKNIFRLTVLARPGVLISYTRTSLSIIRQVADGIWIESDLTRCWRAKRPAEALRCFPDLNSSTPS